MAEISTTGYQSIRNFIQANWTYLELRKTDGTPVLRLSTADPRVVYTNVAGAQTLEITVSLKGSDTDITLPQEFAQSAIFSDGSSTNAFSVESFTAFTMESTLDELTVKHQIEVPEII
jgi:hypothetical protein